MTRRSAIQYLFESRARSSELWTSWTLAVYQLVPVHVIVGLNTARRVADSIRGCNWIGPTTPHRLMSALGLGLTNCTRTPKSLVLLQTGRWRPYLYLR